MKPRSSRAALAIVYGIVFAAGLLSVAPSLLGVAGLTPMTVRGSSMSPTFHDGDALLTRSVRASAIKVGDVVTFPDPDPGRGLITHRVVQQRRSGETLNFVTQGDASKDVEHWSMASDGRLGLHAFRIPHLGGVAAAVSDPRSKAAGLGFAMLFLVWKRRASAHE